MAYFVNGANDIVEYADILPEEKHVDSERHGKKIAVSRRLKRQSLRSSSDTAKVAYVLGTALCFSLQPPNGSDGVCVAC